MKYKVILPDGSKVTRTSDRVYTHIVAVRLVDGAAQRAKAARIRKGGFTDEENKEVRYLLPCYPGLTFEVLRSRKAEEWARFCDVQAAAWDKNHNSWHSAGFCGSLELAEKQLLKHAARPEVFACAIFPVEVV